MTDGAAATTPEQEGGLATEVRPSPDSPWVVIVWNDPVNLMSYVTYIFQTLLGHPRPTAERLMLDVHRKGRAAVSHGARDAMEMVVTKLHSAGLWATMTQDR